MIRALFISTCLVVGSAFSLMPQNAHAQGVPQYTDGPVTEEDYIEVQYGHEDEYIAWLAAKWKPTMKALKKAGIIIDYHIFRATPRSPGLPNFILWITFKNFADALDKQAQFNAVTDKVICGQVCQNKARVLRNQYRNVLGTDYIRELILP